MSKVIKLLKSWVSFQLTDKVHPNCSKSYNHQDMDNRDDTVRRQYLFKHRIEPISLFFLDHSFSLKSH